MQYVTARSLLLTLAPGPRRLAFYREPRTMAGGWVHTAPMGRGITTMNTFRTAFVGLTLLSSTTLVRADTITDWTQTALDVMRPGIVADPNASAEAAAAGAAREILMRQYPGQKARIDTAFAATLEKMPDSPARAAGIALGEKVAAMVFTDRQNDDTNVPDTYRPMTRPGVWVPTTPPLFPQYATAKPWGMKSASQFRPGPPPKLSSALYARDYNEVKEFGGVKSIKRSDAQSDAVRFWTQANLGPAWYQAATQLSAQKGLGLADNARLFALLSMGLANCFITDWDAKFTYNFWRPVTAIRNGDQDGNDATERDAGWVPVNATPMHPEYP